MMLWTSGSWDSLCRSNPQYPQRVEGDHLVGSGPAPVDDLDRAAWRAGRLPPVATGPPAAVRAPAALQNGEGVRTAWVTGTPQPREHEQALEDVVVPVRGIVQGQPIPADDRPGTQRTKQPVLQEQLGGTQGRRTRIGLPGRAPVLEQSPRRGERLVEGRASPVRPGVAVPTAIRPLPPHQRLGQQLHPGSRPSPSREHTAKAFPSWEAWQRTSPSTVTTLERCSRPVNQSSTVPAARKAL